jgi:hypothetical protein
MASSNSRLLAVCLCGWVLVALAGCQKAPGDDISWAQRALERNDELQVVAVDPKARAFTVRMKNTGELRIVQADEIVGSLPSAVGQASASTAANAAPPEKPPIPEPTPAAPATNVPELASAPEAQVAATPAPTATGAGVISAGPGYRINAARADTARASGFAPADGAAVGLAVERRDEPIICQGARFLRIDSRNLEFAGDAISAEDGCEMHITNSRIAAKGVGVSARAANVHIENSSIEGQSGSILASEGAQVYTEASRFRGVSRGLTPESLHDLGGNVWN